MFSKSLFTYFWHFFITLSGKMSHKHLKYRSLIFKDDDQTEGTELIEQDTEKKEENAPAQTKIKLPNPFKKNKAGDIEEGIFTVFIIYYIYNIYCININFFIKSTNVSGEKTGENKDRLKLLETIRLPLVSVFQRMKKNSESQNLTNNQAQAGLASMETLDDKSNDGKSNSELKNIALDEKKEAEKQETEVHWSQKLKTYRIAIGRYRIYNYLRLT